MERHTRNNCVYTLENGQHRTITTDRAEMNESSPTITLAFSRLRLREEDTQQSLSILLSWGSREETKEAAGTRGGGETREMCRKWALETSRVVPSSPRWNPVRLGKVPLESSKIEHSQSSVRNENSGHSSWSEGRDCHMLGILPYRPRLQALLSLP